MDFLDEGITIRLTRRKRSPRTRREPRTRPVMRRGKRVDFGEKGERGGVVDVEEERRVELEDEDEDEAEGEEGWTRAEVCDATGK